MLREAELYCAQGVDAFILENHGDAPFAKDEVEPHVVAASAVYAAELCRKFSLPVGINLLRNDALGAYGAAAAAGAAFIRVNVLTGITATDQGLIEGKANELLRYRARVGVDTAILADLDVKFGTPLYRPDLGTLARSTALRGGADGLIVSGTATGAACDLSDLAEVKSAIPEHPLFVGSGVTSENLGDLLRFADGVIVGSALKEEGYVENPVSKARLENFAKAWKSQKK